MSDAERSEAGVRPDEGAPDRATSEEANPEEAMSGEATPDHGESYQATSDRLLGWMTEELDLGATPERLDREVEARLSDMLLSDSLISEVGQLVLALLVGVVAWGSAPTPLLGGWLGAVAAGAVIRRSWPSRVRKSGGSPREVLGAVRLAVVVPALAWGVGAVVVAPALSFAQLSLVMVTFAGMVAAGLNTLAGDPISLRRFTLLLLGTLVVALLRHGQTRLHWVAVALIVIFGVVILIMSGRAYRIITRQVRNARELTIKESLTERERGFLSALLASIPNAVVALHRDGRILGANPGFEKLFGHDPESVIGKDLNELIVPPGQREEARKLDEELAQEGLVVQEVPRQRSDGRQVTVRVYAAPIEGLDEEVMVVLYSDITKLKEAEEAMARAKEAAEEANLAKSEFLATMSHEIRTPLNAIIGMAELLDETELSPQQRDYVQTFRTAGDTLLRLINEVLDLSKIEAGRLELDVRGFDPRELVEETIQVFAVPAHSKGVEIAAHVEPDVPGWLEGDPDRLRQVMVNLIGNAVKFTEEGEVVLEVEKVGENPREHPDRPVELRFSVRDTGPGIPPDQLDKVFERFTQADSSSTRKHGGTGLGLTISAAFVDLMGGQIGADSELGEGSTFHFTVQVAEAPRPSDEKSPKPGDITGIRVLVVDDNATNRLIIQEMIHAWGGTAHCVPGGKEALQALREAVRNPYDLVLLDGQMPGMDGFDVAEAIRSDEELAPATLMMLTSSGSRKDEVERARQVGIEKYMVKPIRRPRLLEAVRAALASQSGAEAESEEADDGAADEAPSGQGRRILLVDDAAENRMLIQAYLKRTPHEVETAENGVEAVDAVKGTDEPFDLVLMDVQMPEMDGYEATRTIRQWERDQENGTRLPILALTAHALQSEREKSVQAGCDAHLTKPIKKKELLAAIAKYSSPEARGSHDTGDTDG